jgi:hypothetical protein
MLAKIRSSVYTFLLDFIRLQLFITLISLPILSAWGISFSLMSPVGNLIFTPWITVFLLISSLIFFTDLVGIPNGLLITLLDYVTTWWLWITSWGQPSWLVGIPRSLFVFFCLLALAAIIITIHKKVTHVIHYIAGYGILVIIATGTLYFYHRSTSVHTTLPYARKHLTLLKKNSRVCLIDHGALGGKLSPDSWIQYTLLSTLNKECGTTTIDHVIALKPSIMTFKALTLLAENALIKKLYLVVWDGESEKQLLWSYGALRRALQKNNTEIVRIGFKEVKISLGAQASITLVPTAKKLSYRKISYQDIDVVIEGVKETTFTLEPSHNKVH